MSANKTKNRLNLIGISDKTLELIQLLIFKGYGTTIKDCINWMAWMAQQYLTKLAETEGSTYEAWIQLMNLKKNETKVT